MTDDINAQADALKALLAGSKPAQREAPQENGMRLATIDRGDDGELRINWSEYNGHPFFNVRMWGPGGDGQLYPKKGVGFTIRVRELPDFAKAVSAAMELAVKEASNG